MKAYLFTLIFLMTSLFSFADNIDIKGGWAKRGPRTVEPAAPQASIEGDIITIFLQDALSNLSVTILDENGSVVYQDVISTNQGSYSTQISVPYPAGDYLITFTHELGYLYGEFKIE